ncbi:hypothetical protein Hanom_Chr15g01391511 [Helianthus anomalus]
MEVKLGKQSFESYNNDHPPRLNFLIVRVNVSWKCTLGCFVLSSLMLMSRLLEFDRLQQHG